MSKRSWARAALSHSAFTGISHHHLGRSSRRICVEHAIADSKHWRALQRWTGRREDLPQTILAIGSLVSDRAAAW